MKQQIAILICFLIYSILGLGQVQEGLVVEQNSGKKPVGGVEIIFADAVPTTSASDGQFRLVFQDKQPGDLIFKESIRKAGYELVNAKDFEIVSISSNNKLAIDVILAVAGTVDAAKKAYYDISDQALWAGFQREKQQLRKDLEAAQLSQQDYLTQISRLQEQYDRQQGQLDALAEKFARINFDDVAPVYEEALNFFKAGRIDEAITQLEDTDPAKRTEEILAEEERLSLAQQEIDLQKEALADEKKQQIETVQLLADMYNLKFDPQKAENQYDQLLRLDSTNLEIITDAAIFFRDQDRYQKAEPLFQKIIVHPESKKWERTLSLGILGEIYQATGRPELAFAAFRDYSRQFEVLVTENVDSPVFKSSQSVGYRFLGDMYETYGDLDSALLFYRKYHQLNDALVRENPEETHYKNLLMTAYFKMGNVYAYREQLDTLGLLWKKGFGLSEELYRDHPEDFGWKDAYAENMVTMGMYYEKVEKPDSAFLNYRTAYAIKRELLETYPQVSAFKEGMSRIYLKMGDMYVAGNQLDSALLFFRKNTILQQELAEGNPVSSAVKRSLGMAYSNLGDTYVLAGMLDSAKLVLLSANQLITEIYQINPQNPDSKNKLAISHWQLGDIHRQLTDKDLAQSSFEKAEQLWTELIRDFPQYAVFQQYQGMVRVDLERLAGMTKEDLIVEQKVGKVFPMEDQIDRESNYDIKVALLQTVIDTLQGIGSAHPGHAMVQEELARAYGFLSWYHLCNGQFDQAETAAGQSLDLEPEHERANIYLALSLWMQGEQQPAEKILTAWKEKDCGDDPCRSIILDKLQELEGLGVAQSDLPAIRTFIEE